MTTSSFEHTMRAHLKRTPFKPFAIEFENGEQWVVGNPEAVGYYVGDNALYFRQDGSFDFVDCENVKQLVELTTAPAN